MTRWQTQPDLKYARSDEWVRIEGDEATIGVSDYAQDQLGDVVYLELPWDDSGAREVAASGKFGDIESVKATSELFSPVGGTIVRVNAALKDHPDLVNTDPYGEGWMVVIKLNGAPGLGDLLDPAAYSDYCEHRDH
ncbi:MAG TPA: glycine cleavage system protein GcvH [Ktedonobacterales bacterium]|jgi:glycine cleavage system H protein|nr:glycine cleavage system protein GcvH [Ktedonobacterales bacterium]